jgi:hypothetical protein
MYLRWSDHLSRGVLPTVVRHSVWSRNIKNEESMARVGPQSHTDIRLLHPSFIPSISWLKVGNVCWVIQSINFPWIQHCKSTLASSACPLWGRSVLPCNVKQQSDTSVASLLHIACYYYILRLWHSMFVAFLFPSRPLGMPKAYICTYVPSNLAILSSSGQASNHFLPKLQSLNYQGSDKHGLELYRKARKHFYWRF